MGPGRRGAGANANRRGTRRRGLKNGVRGPRGRSYTERGRFGFRLTQLSATHD
ncbi:hypothetical protein BN903_76 [Halorubrum sp. AJ67]|nr:hypothetical protein BN903_76 [Halorubrum sp. AJ67]